MTRQELHNEMAKIVSQIVEHYETDFYDYDVEILDNAERENHWHYIWIPRTSGTFLFPVDNAVGMENWFSAILQNFRSELAIYEIFRGNGSLGEHEWSIFASNEANVWDAFNGEHHFDMEVTDQWGRRIWRDTGLFDNQRAAEKRVKEITDSRGGHFWYVNQLN